MSDEMPEPISAGEPVRAESAVHDPYVVPYANITDQWMVRCRCGLMEAYQTEPDAQTRSDQHAEETALV